MNHHTRQQTFSNERTNVYTHIYKREDENGTEVDS